MQMREVEENSFITRAYVGNALVCSKDCHDMQMLKAANHFPALETAQISSQALDAHDDVLKLQLKQEW